MKRLSEAEQDIMMVIWQAGGTVSSSYVQEKLQDTRGWKKTSVLTFLTRLARKGYVKQEKDGKTNVYTPLLSYETYSGREGKQILERMYQNSVRNFVAALVDGEELEEADLRELRAYLENRMK